MNGDGSRELVCDVTYYADGGRRTVIYWKEDGIIYYGFGDELLDEEYDYIGVGSSYSEYLPEGNMLRIYYWLDSLNDFAFKDYAIDLNKLYKCKWESY